MANTYAQIYIHVVFAVQGRQNLIRPEHKDELQKYMTGSGTNLGSNLITINNMPDHCLKSSRGWRAAHWWRVPGRGCARVRG
jgi:hypothetical protein